MGVVVASRVPGKGMARPERDEWLDGIAAELAELHRLLPTESDRATLFADPGSQRTWLTPSAPAEVGDVGRTIWSTDHRGLLRLQACGRSGSCTVTTIPGNVLSARGQVTAVIDWEAAMLGPPAYDVGYCHLDLTLAHGPDVGDNFLDAYVRHAGGLPDHLTLFQLVAIVRASTQLADWLPSWHAQGVQHLTLEVLEQRLERFATSTLGGDIDCRTTTDEDEPRLASPTPDLTSNGSSPGARNEHRVRSPGVWWPTGIRCSPAGALPSRIPCPREQTVFRIASMTKSFTATAIMILRDRGLVRLDDVVADIAPEFTAVVGPTTDSPPITVRDLLSMAAGMATDDAWADRHLDMADDEFDALVAKGATFAWAPQTHGEYSNLGYAMLGRVIRHAGGRRAQDFITSEVIQPLGMSRTTWMQPNDEDWATTVRRRRRRTTRRPGAAR